MAKTKKAKPLTLRKKPNKPRKGRAPGSSGSDLENMSPASPSPASGRKTRSGFNRRTALGAKPSSTLPLRNSCQNQAQESPMDRVFRSVIPGISPDEVLDVDDEWDNDSDGWDDADDEEIDQLLSSGSFIP